MTHIVYNSAVAVVFGCITSFVIKSADLGVRPYSCICIFHIVFRFCAQRTARKKLALRSRLAFICYIWLSRIFSLPSVHRSTSPRPSSLLDSRASSLYHFYFGQPFATHFSVLFCKFCKIFFGFSYFRGFYRLRSCLCGKHLRRQSLRLQWSFAASEPSPPPLFSCIFQGFRRFRKQGRRCTIFSRLHRRSATIAL